MNASLISIIFLSLVHIGLGIFKSFSPPRLLSFGSGVAIAYVFVDLLPKLCLSDQIVQESGFLPFFERHVYVLALIGFLYFYFIEKKRYEIFSVAGYVFFNYLIGYSIGDINDQEVRPLALFTFAIGLHYFTTDYAMREKNPVEYHQLIRWLSVIALFAGWGTNYWVELSKTAVALMAAFIAGGVILNVTR
ncbi:MAG: hypothetical protein ACK4HV_09075, partial [Parachlamydiaceae bacterium]